MSQVIRFPRARQPRLAGGAGAEATREFLARVADQSATKAEAGDWAAAIRLLAMAQGDLAHCAKVAARKAATAKRRAAKSRDLILARLPAAD